MPSLNLDLVKGALTFLVHVGASIIIAPYRYFYHENTRDPIISILRSQDVLTIKNEIDRWLKLKQKEAQYVQAAVSYFPFISSGFATLSS